jgi:hypothetical protein
MMTRSHTDIPSDIAVKSRKDDITVFKFFWAAFSHHEVADSIRHGMALLPTDSVLVLFSSGPFRRSDGLQIKVWMKRQEEYKSLTYGPRGSKNT